MNNSYKGFSPQLSQRDQTLSGIRTATKGRLALLISLFLIPILGLSGLATWLYIQNRQLVQSTHEVVGQIEALNREVETLNRKAGISSSPPPIRATPVKASQVGRGGIPAKIPTAQQLEIARAQLPALSNQLQTQTKPAIEKLIQQEAAVERMTPSGNPVQGAPLISSDFGIRYNPFGGGGYEGHDGVDILGAHGTPIYATSAGVVERSEFSGGYGNHVLIKNKTGYETLYAHLSKLAVASKTTVRKGQLIGYMGSTGRSTGTHLHYSVYLKGKPVDPKPTMGGNLKFIEELDQVKKNHG
jgi:murein DD-endopeptidase MepM/ murein hydrolase activator NlpD